MIFVLLWFLFPQLLLLTLAFREYVANKTRKTEERHKAIEDINAVIQQIYRDQDLTQGELSPLSDW